jgi:dienelactone hydrolase
MRSLLFLLALSSAMASDEITVLDPASKPAEAFEGWLVREFNELCDKRSAAFEVMIKSEKACKAWQQERRAFFLERIGGLPARTPLNPQITGTLTGKGYRVEKIMLETRPAFHLTANLYLPNTPPPWPAVLVPCGHSHEGKAVGQYQLICMLLARHGMAAMCYDPIGQGERYQMLDLAKERAVFDDAPHVKVPHPNVRLVCTTEHTMTAISSALIGANAAQFRIWDGMRVIDYLQSRQDILADKIGCTGNSGGGTETAYLMALDDRILAAAPGCYLTTFKKLIETKGPQDGEQNIAGQIAFGMDEADYCIMRA